MGRQLFTSKKMKLEKVSWLKKSMIGVTVMAVLSAAGFGVYSWAGSESQAPQESRQSRTNTASEPKRNGFLPSFASNSNNVKGNFSGKKKAEHKSKKSKGHKVASHKKHKGHKVASHKKLKGHKISAHKKKHGKKMAHKGKSRHGKDFAAN